MMRMWKIALVICSLVAVALGARAGDAVKSPTKAKALTLPSPGRFRFVTDMAYDNPGETPQQSEFKDPAFLKSWGYRGQAPRLFVQCAITYESFDPALLPKGLPARQWVDKEAQQVDEQIKAAHVAGIKLYPFTDILIVPSALLEKYGRQMKTSEYQQSLKKTIEYMDIQKPMTQRVVRQQIAGIFDRFPNLDGLTLRFGETYLDDTPYHGGGSPVPTNGGEPAIQAHITLLKILREEVCVKRHKMLFYRTWDFGNFHTNPDFYLKVTDAIEPHPNLVFSIKHQAGDYHRMTPFNPCLGIGKHQQIVEVQCQLEAYGKGANPYYVGQGVIDGWEETAREIGGYLEFTGKPADPGAKRGIRELVGGKQLAGVWTWSRGGGFRGPYIKKNELWCELNAYVVGHWALDPSRTEEDVFNEFARKRLGVKGKDLEIFRQIALLSAKGGLRGQMTAYGHNNLWWTRDQFIGGIPTLQDSFDSIIQNGKVEEALAEKAEAAAIWTRIEQLARQIHVADPAQAEFIRTSCSYGRIKYAIYDQAWQAMLLGYAGDKTGQHDWKRIGRAIARYDKLWAEWRELAKNHSSCATLYKDTDGWDVAATGVGVSINQYRKPAAEAR